MSPAPRLFRINADKQTSRQVREAEFAALGLQERYDIQEWIAANPSILGDDLLVIAKEYARFDWTNERLDLLAVDSLGNLVIIELKRDDTGADVHWQAIKYASYLNHATPAQIVGMLADYAEISKEEAEEKLLRHLDAGDLGSLNRGQRIIIASHRFAREVTSAVLWINERMDGDVITCIQLTPYQDGDSLYLQANTLIPVPGTEGYRIGIGDRNLDLQPGGGNPDTAEVRDILSRVIASVNSELDEPPGEINRRGTPWGWWHLWHDRDPWEDWNLCYNIVLRRKSTMPDGLLDKSAQDMIDDEWIVAVSLMNSTTPEALDETLGGRIDDIPTDGTRIQKYDSWTLLLGADELNEEFIEEFADMVTRYIKVVTPEVNQAYERGEFADEEDEEDEQEDA